jgi:hypothetical protein
MQAYAARLTRELGLFALIRKVHAFREKSLAAGQCLATEFSGPLRMVWWKWQLAYVWAFSGLSK